MRKKIGLIFPHQLFKDNPLLGLVDSLYIIEDSLFFGDKHHLAHFHKQKLAFHRATMKSYQRYLVNKGVPVTYIEYNPERTMRDTAKKWENEQVFVVDPTDYLLEKRLRETIPDLTLLSSPLFINTKQENEEYLEHRKTYLMHHFYQWQRKRLDILMDPSGKPIGGKWSYDDENRKKIPKSEYKNIPDEPKGVSNVLISEAKEYVQKKFPKNPGSLDSFMFPIDHEAAQKWFDDFLTNRFEKFGPYEDAITSEHHVLYHSLLSPLLNVGLLNPKDIVEASLKYAREHDTPTNSVEGFLRQIIGWREYMRMVYEAKGATMRTSNEWNHQQDLSPAFYDGSIGIEPIDRTIAKVLATAYGHHIERLMVLGNAMFLLQIHPDKAYRWFMEMFIDAYDWVMVPNVYAMSQNSAHGIITTKPYVSGSNYILKMSDYKRGDWCRVWDALYWNFITDNIEALEKNGRMHFVTNRARTFTQEQIKNYEKTAQDFRKSLLGE